MKVGSGAVGAQFQKGDALEPETNNRAFFCVAITFIPQTALGFQQVGMFTRELKEVGTAETVFALDNETQGDWKFAKSLLIGFDRHDARQQIAFAVRRPTCIELPVENRA